jgi:hypothetical protein
LSATRHRRHRGENMAIDLRGRSFLKEVDFTKEEFTYLIT